MLPIAPTIYMPEDPRQKSWGDAISAIGDAFAQKYREKKEKPFQKLAFLMEHGGVTTAKDVAELSKGTNLPLNQVSNLFERVPGEEGEEDIYKIRSKAEREYKWREKEFTERERLLKEREVDLKEQQGIIDEKIKAFDITSREKIAGGRVVSAEKIAGKRIVAAEERLASELESRADIAGKRIASEEEMLVDKIEAEKKMAGQARPQTAEEAAKTVAQTELLKEKAEVLKQSRTEPRLAEPEDKAGIEEREEREERLEAVWDKLDALGFTKQKKKGGLKRIRIVKVGSKDYKTLRATLEANNVPYDEIKVSKNKVKIIPRLYPKSEARIKQEATPGKAMYDESTNTVTLPNGKKVKVGKDGIITLNGRKVRVK